MKAKQIGKMLGLACITIIVYYTCRYFINRNDLRVNGVFTNGKIIKVKNNYRGYLIFDYAYSVGEKEYGGEVSGIDFSNEATTYFIGKTFPVLYSKRKPELGQISITPSDFKKYNRAFPDSLSWVLEYMVNN